MRIVALLVIAIALFARLYFVIAYYGNFDQESYEIVIDIMRRGGNVYAETARYNYSPIWSWILLGLSYVSLPLHISVRGFLTLVDLVNAILLARLTKFDKRYLLYWLNPAAILIVGFHGQFETLSLLPLLAALCLSKSAKSEWLFATASLIVKHITLPGVWLIFTYRSSPKIKGLIYLAASIAVFALTFLPYWRTGSDGIISNVLLYASIPGYFGLSSILPRQYVYAIFACVMILLPWLLRDLGVPRLEAFALIFLAFIVFTPGVGWQYFLLVLLTGLVLPLWGYIAFSLSATAWILGQSVDGLGLSFIPYWPNFVWLVAVLWLGDSLYKTIRLSSQSSKPLIISSLTKTKGLFRKDMKAPSVNLETNLISGKKNRSTH